MPEITTSKHGRIFGLDAFGRLVNRPSADTGDAKTVGRRAFSNTAASTAVTNTTAETAFDTSYSIPPNVLQAGDVIRVRFQGIATATNATDTLLIRLRIGGLTGTVVLLGTATDVANNDIFEGEATLVVRTAGAAGTIVGTCRRRR
jgi:hypothetical protein